MAYHLASIFFGSVPSLYVESYLAIQAMSALWRLSKA